MLADFRLKVFMAVSEEGNFTKAARKLGISQPAVSQNVAELEKDLDVSLFQRSRGAVTLTAAGLAFKDYATQILGWYNAAEEMFGPSGRINANRPVRISADGFCAECIVPDLLSSLMAVNPKIAFKTVVSGDCDVRIWCDPHTGELSLEDSAGYVGDIEAVALTSDQTLAGIEDLRKIPSGVRLAVWSPYSGLLSTDIKARIAMELDSSSSVVRFVSSAPGTVGLVPRQAASGNGLFRLPVGLPQLLFDLKVSPSDIFARTPLYSNFTKFLKKLLFFIN